MKVKGFNDTIKWYDENAKEYARMTYQVSSGNLLNQFISFLPSNPTILDAGCGAGRDSGLLQTKGAKVTGLDISEGLLKEAAKRNPEVTFVQGNFLALPFKDETFDGIWARASLVHLESIEYLNKSLGEFYRVLKKKGIVHIYTREQIGVEKTALVSDRDTPHQRFFRFYTKEEMKQALEKIGFFIKEIESHDDPHERKEIRWISLFAEK